MTTTDRIWTCTFAYNPNREYFRATHEAHANRVANHMARTFGWGRHGALRVAVSDCEAEEFPGAFDYRGVVPVEGNAVPYAQPYGGTEGQWAGDGSGLDDLADFNALEGNDY